jgi:hypothetical protein
MRIAFFGLNFHERTGSSAFMLALLRAHAEVDVFSAEADIADVRRQCTGFDEWRYDAIVIWQLQEAFVLLSGRHPNVTFTPMYDAMWRGGVFTWRPSFNYAKILCFSWALRRQVMRQAPVYAQVQYYPDPARFPASADFSTLRAFFWYRRRDIPIAQMLALAAGARFESLTIHDAPDPGHTAPFDWATPPHIGRLARTVWTPDGRNFAEALAAANVFFAPRPMEGIGMSFLEAMASGLCVVALDAPTMNEVISHGVNGLLYAPGRRAPLDFGRAREMGARAREDVVRGRARWEAQLPEILEFLTTPTAKLRERGARLALPLPTEARLAVVPPPTTGGLAGLLATVEAEWLLFLPHGHTLLAPEALKEMLAQLPCGTLAVLGHHLQVLADGSEALCRVGAPLAAWNRLLEGETMPEAPAGMPVPAATLLHRDLLRQAGAEAPASAAALAALLLPALAAGAGVVVRDAVVARLPMLTAAQAKAERAAWLAIGKVSGVTIAERNTVAPPRLAALATRLALSSVALLDRVSPRLGWAAEARLRATQRWRRRHAATP